MEPPLQLLVIVVAMAVGSFVKGATGTGLPQIAIPVMATFLGVERAVVIMALPGIVSNGWMIWASRGGRHETRDLPSLLIAGTIGGVAGTVLLKTLDGRVLSIVLAVIILGYVVVATVHPGLRLGPRLTRILSPPVGLVAGGLQGATGISGPLLTTYLHGFGLTPQSYVFSITVIFLVFSVVQTSTLFGIGLYTQSRLLESLLALVPIAIMLPVGTWVGRRLSAETFKRVILVLLAGTAVKLIVDAVAG